MRENKLLMIFGALIIPFAIFMIVRGLVRRESVPVGEACTYGTVDECQDGQCVLFESDAICTTMCATADDCPDGMKCELTKVTIAGAPGVAMEREYEANYCVP